MKYEKDTLERSVQKMPIQNKAANQPSPRKIAFVDTFGNIIYPTIPGIMLDYFSGLDLKGIIAARTYTAAINGVAGGLYGWWREKMCDITKTTEKSSKIRRTLTDLLAFNTFQVPLYATAIAIGNLVSEGSIDWEKVRKGATYLTAISPLIGPVRGWFLDGFRKLFKIKSAAEGAYKKTPTS